MKRQNKNRLLDDLQEEVNRQSQIVKQQFSDLDPKRLLATSENGGWSVIQNLEHLNLYYAYYNPAIKQSLNSNTKDQSASTFKSGWLGKYFTNSMDYRKKGKVKAFKDYIPNPDLDANAVINQFISNQDEMLKLLEEAKDYDLSNIKIPISLTKWIKMKLGDVFQFVIMHNERHVVQAQSRL